MPSTTVVRTRDGEPPRTTAPAGSSHGTNGEPGKRADLTVVSLAGSSFLPWEDPAAAVVLGGSPSRVLTTIVDGTVRYERGGFDWRELQQRGESARSRLLGSL